MWFDLRPNLGYVTSIALDQESIFQHNGFPINPCLKLAFSKLLSNFALCRDLRRCFEMSIGECIAVVRLRVLVLRRGDRLGAEREGGRTGRRAHARRS
jgi:hypothetical protein